MLLVTARVENFRSVEDSGEVEIDPHVTVFVGQNESGKTAFLNALDLSYSTRPDAGFDLDRDHPRKALNDYRRVHDTRPAVVTRLTYRLSADELTAVNAGLGLAYFAGLEFTVTHHANNTRSVRPFADEAGYVRHLLAESGLPADVRQECETLPSVRRLIGSLAARDLAPDGKRFLDRLKARFQPTGREWDSLLDFEVWTKHLAARVPKFFYFDDYSLLPGKVNLPGLAERAKDPGQLTDEDRSVLSLLTLAGVGLDELTDAQGYERVKARLEALSNSITDAVFRYWTQNRELDVEFDIRADPAEPPPFNTGPNLYVRVKGRRHRVTLPFSQRSKGFIWFFSFIVRFDAVRRQQAAGQGLILLFDEPGLNLHAVAQADFRRYLDDLAGAHQVLYTTHSPFLVPADRPERLRLVEDRAGGTVVTADLAEADAKTAFPLQAALGYAVAQNLFVGERNLLVGGPAELVYLRFASATLARAGRVGLRDDITVVPAGGLDRLTAFLALQGADQLDFVVLHDGAGPATPAKAVLPYGRFRDPAAKPKDAAAARPGGVEDLFSVPTYLKLFNAAFEKPLGKEVKEADLPAGDRVTDRLTRYLADAGIALRPAGGFHPYVVAAHLATNPPTALDKDTLARFEALFKRVNGLVSAAE